MRLRDEIDACSPPWPVGRGPHESLHSKVLWGKGGMTERYEKSPGKPGLFEWSTVHSDVELEIGLEPTTC